MNSPCMGCRVRHPTCHASCAKYAEYRAKMDQANKEKSEFLSAKRHGCYEARVDAFIKKARKKKRGRT